MTFGEKIRYLRRKNNLTQAELADKAGVTLRTVRGWESEGRYPKRRALYGELAGILGVDSEDLISADDAFIMEAGAKGGSRGRRQAGLLVNELGGLFAGGELSEEDKDAVMRDLQDAYWRAKDENRRKYTPAKYRTDKNEAM
ncbi:MAG: helix-turn-helix transcriptional regulator [Eubacterium sp.]|nr:helix-turn-helix transcriptional regulator [Eubacterium sp.]